MDLPRYEHFDKMSTPIVVLNTDSSVVYKNKASSKLFPRVREGDPFVCLSGDGDLPDFVKKNKPAVFRFRTQAFDLPVLLIPDPGETAVIAVFAEFLYGYFSYSPSALSRCAPPAADGASGLPPVKELAALAPYMIAPLAAAVSASFAGVAGDHSAAELVLLLNRYGARVLEPRGLRVRCRCTADCDALPLRGFAELAAALVCLSILFTANSSDGKTDLTVFLEGGSLHVLFTYSARRDVPVGSLADTAPDRRGELALIEAVLSSLGYACAVYRVKDKICAEFTGVEKVPLRFLYARTKNAPHAFDAVVPLLDALSKEIIPLREERP